MALHFCERYKIMVLKIGCKFELRRFCRTTGAVAMLKLGVVNPDDIGHVDSISVEEIGGARRGRSAEAEAEFGKLLGGLHVKSLMVELSKSNRGDEVDSLKLSELLYGRHFRVVFIGSALLALQQLSGINAVFYFSSTVFKSAGVPSDIANMFVGVVNLSVVAMVLMDKLGRKGLLLGSFMGMALSMTMQAVAGSTLVSEPSVVYLSVGGVPLMKQSFLKTV